MEAKEKQIIITEKWLEKNGARKDELQTFKKHFPNGGEALEILKQCEELDYIDFGGWLLDHLPPIYPPLELNTFVGNLFYPNDVHIKGDVSIQGFIHIKGILKIDGKLTVKKYGSVYSDKDCVTADEIDLSGYVYIHARIKANRIDMRGEAIISGDTKAKVVNLDGGRIYGNVDADELYNDGGYISQNAKADKATLINGGNIGGNIAFKCLYTDSNFYAQIFRAS